MEYVLGFSPLRTLPRLSFAPSHPVSKSRCSCIVSLGLPVFLSPPLSPPPPHPSPLTPSPLTPSPLSPPPYTGLRNSPHELPQGLLHPSLYSPSPHLRRLIRHRLLQETGMCGKVYNIMCTHNTIYYTCTYTQRITEYTAAFINISSPHTVCVFRGSPRTLSYRDQLTWAISRTMKEPH